MLDITLEQLIDVLGAPTKQTGCQYYFRCPVCAQSGNDKHGDNLLFNDKKKLLKCFACEEGSRYVLKMLRKKAPTKYQYTPVDNKPVELWWKKNYDNLWQYWEEAYSEQTEQSRRWLNEQGITNETIDEWMIGFDNNPSIVKIGPCVCFPMISLYHDSKLVGFELRQISKEKIIRHTYDSPKCLCLISDNIKAAKLVICEGFKDAYCFMQIVTAIGQKEQFTILTPSHGVDSIIDCLSCIDFSRYKKHFLLLDNDDAGDRVTEQIIEKYNMFEDCRVILHSYKDVNELWLNEHDHTKRVSKKSIK